MNVNEVRTVYLQIIDGIIGLHQQIHTDSFPTATKLLTEY